MKIKFDRAWVIYDQDSAHLRELGYVCGVEYVSDSGKPLDKFKYTLHTWDKLTGKAKEIGKFDSPEELNTMLKVLVPPDTGD